MYGEKISGVAPDLRQDESPEFHGIKDQHDDQNLIKKSLVGSYKKSIYPCLKEEIARTCQDPPGGPLAARSKHVHELYILGIYLNH